MSKQSETSPDPRWLLFEKEVAELHETLGSVGDKVLHNVHIPGTLSGMLRQIDVACFGLVAGELITVAVECKCYERRVSIQVVESFIGKLLDIGAERGVIYSYSEFTSGARMRASGARSPRLGLVVLRGPDFEYPDGEQTAKLDEDELTTASPIVEERWFVKDYREFLEDNIFLYRDVRA